MGATQVICRTPGVVSQTLAGDEGSVLLNLDTGVYHGLNPVGTRIWELLETPRTEAELRKCIAQEFEVEPEVASTDVRAFLESLDERKLVQLDRTP